MEFLENENSLLLYPRVLYFGDTPEVVFLWRILQLTFLAYNITVKERNWF